MTAHKTIALGAPAALIIAGVLLEGTQHNPWNLSVSCLLAITIMQVQGKLPPLAAWLLSTAVVGLAIYGAAWTLGPEHAASAPASLVYVGLAGLVLSSAIMPSGRPM
jgi:hypothetical protein